MVNMVTLPVGVEKDSWLIAPEVDLTTDDMKRVGETALWVGFSVR